MALTNKELREKLESFPDEAPVVCEDEDGNVTLEVVDVVEDEGDALLLLEEISEDEPEEVTAQ